MGLKKTFNYTFETIPMMAALPSVVTWSALLLLAAVPDVNGQTDPVLKGMCDGINFASVNVNLCFCFLQDVIGI